MWFLKTHLSGITFGRLLIIAYSRSKQIRSAKVGGINFYGNYELVEQCLLAVTEELPKYDDSLSKLFLSGTVHLKIVCDRGWVRKTKNTYEKSPPTGFYSIPEIFWREGPEGICAFIVYSYFLTSCTGTGILSALHLDLTKAKPTKLSKGKMITWIREKKFPNRYIGCFE